MATISIEPYGLNTPVWEINYELLADWVVQSIDSQARMTGAYYYTGFSEQSGLDRFLGGLETKRGFFVRREPIVERESSCPHCQASIRYQVEKACGHSIGG